MLLAQAWGSTAARFLRAERDKLARQQTSVVGKQPSSSASVFHKLRGERVEDQLSMPKRCCDGRTTETSRKTWHRQIHQAKCWTSVKGLVGAPSSPCDNSRVAWPCWHEVPSIDLRRQFGRHGLQSAISKRCSEAIRLNRRRRF